MNAGGLMRHIHQMHPDSGYNNGPRPYVCEVCGQRFRTNRDRSRHLQGKHRMGAPRQCQLCCKEFYSRHGYRNHVKNSCAEKRKMDALKAQEEQSAPVGNQCHTSLSSLTVHTRRPVT